METAGAGGDVWVIGSFASPGVLVEWGGFVGGVCMLYERSNKV